jgi:hypothetical protein
MKSKLQLVAYNAGLDAWLNSIRRDNWHFLKMEPYLQVTDMYSTHEVGKFLVSARHDPAKASIYHSEFIGNTSGNSKFNFDKMEDINTQLTKCGYELLDYRHVFSLRLEGARSGGPAMKGYLFLWGLTFDSATAANTGRISEWIWGRLVKEEGALPENVNTNDEFIGLVKRIIKLDNEAVREQMGDSWEPDMESIEPDADTVSFHLPYSRSKEFIEETLWRIAGNLTYKSLYEY